MGALKPPPKAPPVLHRRARNRAHLTRWRTRTLNESHAVGCLADRAKERKKGALDAKPISAESPTHDSARPALTQLYMATPACGMVNSRPWRTCTPWATPLEAAHAFAPEGSAYLPTLR